ncbi:hypothetical protein KUTeg_000847, partial [Tegillarca granosa]
MVAECPEPLSIVNATMDPGNNLVGSTRQYTCEHFPSCSKPITCKSDGAWTSTNLICETASFCDTGWMLFSGSCYSLRRQLKTWHNAMLGMHKINRTDVSKSSPLFNIHENENAITVLEFRRRRTIDEMFIINSRPTHDFWIDGTDADVEGSWKYGSTGSIFGFTDWYPGEPNNDQNQDCAGLYRSYNFRWEDGFCNGT